MNWSHSYYLAGPADACSTYSTKDMIALLDTGMAVEKLLELIESGLVKREPPCWTM
jgi:hypothetical protein